MAFPSTLSTFNRPATTDRLNNPSHSALHNTVSSALGQVEAGIGVDGANSVLGTIIGDMRSPGSGGGGHVQTANLGGTGQTSYNKGDILVASSSSVLTKLAVGTDGYILATNPSVATGINWIANSSPKIFTQTSMVGAGNAAATASSILIASILGSTLGTSNIIRTTAYFQDYTVSPSILTRVLYGGGLVASVLTKQTPGNLNMAGTLVHTMIANNSATSQKNFIQLVLTQKNHLADTTTSVVAVSGFSTSSINSGAGQDYRILMNPETNTDINIIFSTIEKIN